MFGKLVPEYIANLETYRAGKNIKDIKKLYGLDRVVKLASNENPWGPSPRAIEAVQQALWESNRYPDPAVTELREALARRFHLSLDNIIVGNGSEGILAFIARAFLHGDDEVITSKGAFPAFSILCRTRNIEPKAVDLRGFRFDLPAMASQINDRTKIIYLCNPNNPTGTFFTRQEFDQFMSLVPERVLVLLDEAYFEFAQSIPDYPDSMDYRYDNVITLRTFSKCYGLAGFRVGYGFGHPQLIQSLWKVKLPFQPTHLAQVAAVAALEDENFLQMTVDLNAQGRQQLSKGLRDLGFQVIPSCTNFVACQLTSASEAGEVTDQLLKSGVIIRILDQMGLPDCIRISVGRPEEIQFCLETLAQIRMRRA